MRCPECNKFLFSCEQGFTGYIDANCKRHGKVVFHDGYATVARRDVDSGVASM